MSLLDDIEEAIVKYGLNTSDIGTWSVKDHNLVRNMRAGRRINPDTERRVREYLAILDQTGKSLSRPVGRPASDDIDGRLQIETTAYAAARQGSDNLLRRQLETGFHWITDRARFAAACESVGLQ